MSLQRNIVYILSIIALLSFVGLLLPCSGVITNVCSGLFSGAVIGTLTSIAQYYKIRQEYFANVYLLLKEYYKAFEVDESLIRQSVEYLRAHTQKEIKKYHNFNDFEKVNTCMIDQYSSLSDGVTYNEYVSLNPFEKRVPRLLKTLDHEVWFARGELIYYHDRLYSVTRAKNRSEIDDCIYDRGMLYTALSSGVQCIYRCAEEIGERLNLASAAEYRSWQSTSDNVFNLTIENEDWIMYGHDIDADSDDPGSSCLTTV